VSSSSASPPSDSQKPRIPSPLQALLVWLTAALTMVGASVVVAAAAAAMVFAQGQNAAQTFMDPAKSPLTTSSTWIAVGTLANELAVVATLAVWWLILKPEAKSVFPLGRPAVLGVMGALFVVFGLAPLAEAAGELTHHLIGNEVTASLIVVNAARNATPWGMVLLLFALAVMPALAEEALFRGLLTAPFEHRFVLGVIVPSVLFGIFHLEPTQIAGTVILGVGFALARLCTGTLLTSAITHAVYNASVVVTVRYSDAVAEHQLDWRAVGAGAALAALGGLLLWRERRLLVARRSGGRPDLPSWTTFG
jgi:membrane protease YdiL (CAAX protease family)